LKEFFQADIRTSIHFDLSHSDRLFEDRRMSEASNKSDGIDDKRDYLETHEKEKLKMHDFCIAYGLYQEYGRIMNIYDWYRAFCLRCAKDDVKDNDQDDDKMNRDPILLSRFISAMSALLQLGLVMPCTRKRDHMLKVNLVSGTGY